MLLRWDKRVWNGAFNTVATPGEGLVHCLTTRKACAWYAR